MNSRTDGQFSAISKYPHPVACENGNANRKRAEQGVTGSSSK